jgi:hypothetical protein
LSASSLGEVDYPRVFAITHPTVLASLREDDDDLALCEGGLPAQL